MKVDASAGRGRDKDLRMHCERMTLRAETPQEAADLAVLLNGIIAGTVTVATLSKEAGNG